MLLSSWFLYFHLPVFFVFINAGKIPLIFVAFSLVGVVFVCSIFSEILDLPLLEFFYLILGTAAQISSFWYGLKSDFLRKHSFKVLQDILAGNLKY